MPTNILPTNTLLTIGQAAAKLNVSIKTLRRWEKSGLVHPIRNKYNQRMYSEAELNNLVDRKYKPLPQNTIAPQQYQSISAAADAIGVSVKTLRRWDNEGKITLPRDELNRRIFTPELIDQIKALRDNTRPPVTVTATDTAQTQPKVAQHHSDSISHLIPVALTPLLSLLPFALVVLPILFFSIIGYKPTLPLHTVDLEASKQGNQNISLQPVDPASPSAYPKNVNPLLSRVPRGEVAGLTVTGGSLLSFENVIDDNFNFGVAGLVEGNQLVSTTTVKPPLIVASQEKVANLNADLLDGHSWEEIANTATASGSTIIGATTLQEAYNGGNTIAVTSDRNLTISGTGTVNIATDLNLNGNSLNTTSSTFNLFNTTATTLNIGGASTTLNLGATTGTTTIKNTLNIAGELNSTNTIAVKPSGDSDDYIYFSTSSDQPGIFFAGATNNYDPGIRVNASSGRIEYRDQGSSTWNALGSSTTTSVFTDGGTYVYPTNRESIRVYDSTGINYIDIAHNGTNVLITTNGTTEVRLDNDLVITGNITPATNATYDLGSTTNRFRDIFVSGSSIHLGTNGNEALIGYNTTNNYLSFNPSSDGTPEFSVYDNGSIAIDGILLTATATELNLLTGHTNPLLDTSAIGTTIQTYNPNTSLLGQTIDESELNITNAPVNGYLLSTDGSGNMSWVDPGTFGGSISLWQNTNEQLYPINTNFDVLVGGTSTASATLSLQATTGDLHMVGNLYTGGVQRLSNTGSLTNVTGNISMWTNDVGYLTLADTETWNKNVWNSLTFDNLATAAAAILTTWVHNKYDYVNTASVGATVQPFNANTSFLGQSINGDELSLTNQAAGDLMYFDGTDWVRLAGAATTGFALKYDTTTNTPYWAADIDTNTTYTASTGITLVGTDFQLDPTYFTTWDQNLWDDLTIASVSAAGFITASSTDTLTNKSGNISMWTNDVGYLTTTDLNNATFWQLNDQQLAPKNTTLDIMTGGTATTSAKFYAQGTTGNGYFAGNLGIGTTAPSAKLSVAGSITGAEAQSLAENNFAFGTSGNAGELDESFPIKFSGASGTVNSIAIQSDGKILIGGSFTSYNGTSRNYIARLNADGSLDTSFNPGTGANSSVRSMATQSDGKILIGGGFTSYNGTSRNYIARLNADGSLDTSFNPGTGASSTINSIAIQSDGKILIGGSFTSYNGTSRNYIARLNADGSLDTSFNPGTGASSTINSIAIQSDGKILIGGWFTSYNGTSRNYIARLNADGSLDTSFNPGTGANGTVYSIAIQSDGKILIGGSFTSYNGTSRNRIARLNADGSLDTSFNPGTGANSSVRSMATQSDGKILIGGGFTSYNGTSRNYIARLNADGSLDTSFNPGTGASSTINSIAIQSDGKILIGGDFTSYNGTSRGYIARIFSGYLLNPYANSFLTSFGSASLFINESKLTILGTNMGLGIDNPTSKLHIRGNSADMLESSLHITNLADQTLLFVRNDGKIGIGTTSPNYNLDISGSLRSTGETWLGSNTTTGGLYLNSSGNVGIGTTAPVNKLHIAGLTDGQGITIDETDWTKKARIFFREGGNANYGGIVGYDAGLDILYLNTLENSVEKQGIAIARGTGNVGIGTVNPQQLLHVVRGSDGPPVRFEDTNGYCEIDPTSTTWTCTSDIRLKKDIESVSQTQALDIVNDLNAVMFHWNKETDSSTKHLGFIAQEVERVVPQLVTTDDNGYKSVSYGSFTPLLTAAIQQLNVKLNDAGNVITNLQTQTYDLTVTQATHTNLLSDLVASIQSLFTRQTAMETSLADLQTQIATLSATLPSPTPIPSPTPTPTPNPLITEVATLSARVSYLEQRVTGQLAPTPVPIATVAGTIDSAPVETRLTDLESRLASLSATVDLSLQLTASQSALIDALSTAPTATTSSVANDLNLDAQSLFISDFLSVMGDTVLTNLTVTNNLTTSSINSLDGNLSLVAGLVTLDGSGSLVTVNGDLTVTGKLTAASLDAPEITQLASTSATISSDLLLLQQMVASLSAQVASLSAQVASPSAATATDSAQIIPSPIATPTSSHRITTLSQLP